jgi:hypothetical protein
MCEDCETEMNAYYDERRDYEMTVDNDLRENYGGA